MIGNIVCGTRVLQLSPISYFHAYFPVPHLLYYRISSLDHLAAYSRSHRAQCTSLHGVSLWRFRMHGSARSGAPLVTGASV